MNTARKNHRGVHWWSVLNISPTKHLLLFDSKGFLGFHLFILDSDNKVLDKVLFDIKRYHKPDNRIRCVEVTFSIYEYRRLKQEEIKQLSTVARLISFIIRIRLH